MCGICGRVSVDPENPGHLASFTKEMMRLLEHRGPDDSGLWSDRHAGLGHQRLSIIDLSPSGHQPMVSEDGNLVLLFNGEIYNFRELKKKFSEVNFRFDNDTEVILKLYEKFGHDCLRYLRGMFAFAIWDASARKLFFARDRLGKKPLFYSRQNGKFVFASELRALLVNQDLAFEIDEESIFHYLTLQYVPSPRTIFKNVFKLPPAHFGVFQNGKLNVERYWQVSYRPQKWSEPDALQRLDELLKQSVGLRMISDVPLGAFLSGGVDSSTIVALMAQASERAVKSFTIRFEEEDFNEADFARDVAERFGTDHQELTVKPDYIDAMSKLVCHFSEPYADSSAIPFYYLSRMTSRHVKVALSGDGGDELFGGYNRYIFSAPNPRFSLPRFVTSLSSHIPVNIRYAWRIRRFVDERTLTLPELYLQKICYFNEQEKKELLSREFVERIQWPDTVHWFENFFRRFADVPFPQNLMAVDTETYLPDDLLVKADIASMACSLEARAPFLDHEVVEFAASLPLDLKIRPGVSKYILKRYMADKLPAALLHRPKMGFGVPIKIWFRKDLREYLNDHLLSESFNNRGYFKPEAVRKMLDRHYSGVFDYSYKLYALLMLELWHRQFLDSRITTAKRETVSAVL
jgi:asparagine synthase (glutamine-hydrolysing)